MSIHPAIVLEPAAQDLADATAMYYPVTDAAMNTNSYDQFAAG